MTFKSPIILIALAIGLFYTFTSPQYSQLKEKLALSRQYNNVIENIAVISAKRDELLNSFNAIPKSQIDKLQKALPDNVDTVRLAVDLDGIAAAHGISIKNVQVANNNSASSISLPDESRPYDKATISFGFVATYDNFMKFLADLEKNLRIMDIRSLSFKATDNGLYEYTMTIDTYWLK